MEEKHVCKTCGTRRGIEFNKQDGLYLSPECRQCGGSEFIRKRTYYEIPDGSLLAIYLLVKAVRAGAYKLILSNNFFRSLWDISRIYKTRLNNFAESDTIRRYFPRFRLGQELAGGTFWMNNLTLYVTEKDNEDEDQKAKCVDSCPKMEEVYKELGVSIIETEVEIDGFKK